MKRIFAGCFLALTIMLAQPQASDPLLSGFQNPPSSARPRVWWHWMNGNITKDGIKLDLEWMKRVGLGGFQNFDAALNTPKVVDKRLIYMTPEWKDAFLFAVKKADELGLEVAIAGSPGWSETGGPWVQPSQAMKKLVWSETRVEGGKPFHGVLEKPPSATGPFQNIARADPLAALSSDAPPPPKEFYADSAVVAFRLRALGGPGAKDATVTASSGQIDAAALMDGNLMQTVNLPKAAVGQKAWIQFEYSKPQTIRAVTLVMGANENPFAGFLGGMGLGPDLEASDDGQNFKTIASLPTDGAVQHTIAFPETTARFFRLSFITEAPGPMNFGDIDPSSLGIQLPPPSTNHRIAELVLHSEPRVNRFEEKAAFATLPSLYPFATAPANAAEVISKSDVIDLTGKMHADGSLDWTPAAGQWTVVRLGYSLLGITNHPASPEATGLEVDKLNHDYVKTYFEHYLDNYKSAVGPLMGKRGVQYVITDSWEAGAQNWTDNMIQEFTKRRGYDPRPWLPVLTGRVVESSESSDRFLWDFRKTIADLVAENHYEQIAASLHARGMGQYGESHETGRATIGDGMEMKRADDIPMSAMWTQQPGVNTEQFGYNADIRESASVAHIYGKNFVAAESLTSASGPWAWAPETLKPTADKELAMGLNRFVIHTSVHQPLIDKAPGLALGPFGQWFTRNETWAEEAQPWISYLARSSYLLQQGRFAADVLCFYGEDSNVTALFANKSPDVPAGYNFDFINADALIHETSVADGQIATKGGMRYRVLALDPNSQHMSLPVLRAIYKLVSDGATVVGPKPTDTPSLSDSQAEFQNMVSQLWGGSLKGHVYSGKPLADVLSVLPLAPDFEYTKPEPDANVLFVHRKLADGDLYFVDNRNGRAETLDATFRVAGKEAELWYADSGKTEPASYRTVGERTTVPLHLDPYGTVFVVFRKPAANGARALPKRAETSVATVEGAWEVGFQADRGAPEKVTLNRLTSWSDNSDEGVKYFSGDGTYTKSVQAPADWFKPGAQLWLDLGDVKNLAAVSVNGKALGVVWKQPFRVDVTGALKPGANTLTIAVTNLWVNRLVGDQQLNAAKKYTFTARNPYKATSPLLPSGLLGPVQIVRSAVE